MLADLTAAILAGGESRRMGQDKAFLPIGGKPLIEIIYGRLSPLFRTILISAKDDRRFRSTGWTVVPDLLPVSCALAGIHAVLTRSETDYTFMVGCDMPWLDTRVIEAMATHLGRPEIVTIESGRGVEPLHTFYSRRCLPRIDEHIRSGNYSVMDLIARSDTVRISSRTFSFLKDPDLPFKNLNTAEEYKKILRGLS